MLCPFIIGRRKLPFLPSNTTLLLIFFFKSLFYEYGVALKVWLPEKSTLLPPAFNPPHVDFQAYPLCKRTKKGGIPLSAFFHLK